MKRHLNTSYRLVWNHITGTLVVASELARSRGKGAGVAVALSLAAVMSVPALAADIVVRPGETVNGGTLANHDNQIVFGTTNGMTISTGLEYGPDNEANTGGQWVQDGGTANKTTVTSGGLQRVNPGGSVSDTVISAGGGQSLQGRAVNTTLNGGEQWMHEGAIATGTVINDKGWQVVKPGTVATDTVVNTGAEGGPDAENGDTGQFVRGDAVRTTINKNGRQIVRTEGTANTTVVYAGGDQTVHGHALDTTLNGGYQYVHNGGTASDTVVNSDGWQIVKNGGVAGNTTVNQKGRLQVDAGGTATNVTLKQGGALVTSTAATVTGINRLGAFSVVEGKADNVVLENGGRLDVLTGHTATNTRVDDGGTLDVRNGGTATTVSMGNGGVLLADSGAAVSGTRSDGKAFSIGGGQADALMLEKGSSFTLNAGDTATDTTVNGGLFTARGGTLAGTTTLNNGAILTLSGKTVNNDTLTIREGDALLQGGSLTGNGSVEKSGSGTLTVSNTTLTQKAVNRDSDESWYLRSENAYRAEVPLYASMLTQAMDYDRIVAGSRSHQTGVNGENNSVRLSIQGGHLGHDNNGGIARGATPESSGSYGFVRLEGDLMRTEVAGMSVTAGVYGAAGHSSVDVKDDDASRAGTVRDDAGSLGGYLNLIHNASGLWADIVALGTRHSMKASTDNNDFRARGWGWLGSLETGLPFSITDNLMLEPQLQYTWQGLSLDDGKDNAGYVKFGHGSAQHVRAGFRLGSHNDMTFGEGTSSRAPLRDSAKHSVSELPVNWWVQPSVIRTFSSRGDMRVGTSTAGSGMTFSPSQNGTSLDLQAGLEARVRENITLGVQAGYAHSVSGSSAEGYNGQATLNVTF
ncbi:AIDA repeat-containing protein [Escherichia coli]|uniref:AIDA repeat-containing protein n=1 Tax=Escherichia coli TaxID=562 RepID=UPI000BE52802|nr:AIDA repeat-containing protein [Escherichia coli]